MQKKSGTGIISAALVITFLAGAGITLLSPGASARQESQTRKLANFHAVRLTVPADLTVEVGTAGDLSIEVDGGDEVLAHLKTTVTNGELLINNDRSFNNIKQIIIKAKTAKLDALNISGAGSTTINGLSGGNLVINADGATCVILNGQVTKLTARLQGASKLKAAPLSAGDVDLKANGACSMTLEGKAEKLSAELLGAGNLKAAALPVKSAIVSVTGTGSAEVNATSDLNASITGAGSIKYKGSPRITKQILGVGSIAKF